MHSQEEQYVMQAVPRSSLRSRATARWASRPSVGDRT